MTSTHPCGMIMLPYCFDRHHNCNKMVRVKDNSNKEHKQKLFWRKPLHFIRIILKGRWERELSPLVFFDPSPTFFFSTKLLPVLFCLSCLICSLWCVIDSLLAYGTMLLEIGSDTALEQAEPFVRAACEKLSQDPIPWALKVSLIDLLFWSNLSLSFSLKILLSTFFSEVDLCSFLRPLCSVLFSL